MQRPPFHRVLTRIALLDGSRRLSRVVLGNGKHMWEMILVSEQSCLRKSTKKQLHGHGPLCNAPFIGLPFTPQMNASQPRRWMSRGGRTLPISTCAGWRKPSGEQRDCLFLVSLSYPAHPRHLPPKQMQKDKSPFCGKGRVEIATFFFL